MSTQSDTVCVGLEVEVANETLAIEAELPDRPGTTEDLLPILYQLDERIVQAAERSSEGSGRPVSCRAGCGACCRQLVPISEPEARAIARLVTRLPAPRADEIRRRFRAAVERLDTAGMHERLRASDPLRDQRGWQALITDYFRLGIACPFLEDESCSIYTERPLACREYLVSSPPANCADPAAPIELIDLPVRLASFLLHFQASAGRQPPEHSVRLLHPEQPSAAPRMVPLILALQWAEDQDRSAEPRDLVELLQELLQFLANAKPAR